MNELFSPHSIIFTGPLNLASFQDKIWIKIVSMKNIYYILHDDKR